MSLFSNKTKTHSSELEMGDIKDKDMPPPDFLGVCNIPFHIFVKKGGSIPNSTAHWCFNNLKSPQCLRTGSTVFYEYFKELFGESIFDATTLEKCDVFVPQDYDFVFNIKDIPDNVLGGATVQSMNKAMGWSPYADQDVSDPDTGAVWRNFTSGMYAAEITRRYEGKTTGERPLSEIAAVPTIRRLRQQVKVNLIIGDDPEFQVFKLATEHIKLYMRKNRHRVDLVADRLLTKSWRAAFFEGIRTFLFMGSRDI